MPAMPMLDHTFTSLLVANGLPSDLRPVQVVDRPYAHWQFPDGQGVQGPAPEASEDLDDRSMAAK